LSGIIYGDFALGSLRPFVAAHTGHFWPRTVTPFRTGKLRPERGIEVAARVGLPATALLEADAFDHEEDESIAESPGAQVRVRLDRLVSASVVLLQDLDPAAQSAGRDAGRLVELVERSRGPAERVGRLPAALVDEVQQEVTGAPEAPPVMAVEEPARDLERTAWVGNPGRRCALDEFLHRGACGGSGLLVGFWPGFGVQTADSFQGGRGQTPRPLVFCGGPG
jgi:hypothetical protein